MFYSVTGLGIGSAASDDGFNWTVEEGLRLESQRIEGELYFDVGHPTVVRLADGRWRMYYQTSTGIDTPLRLFSAISSDGFNFTQEEGVRIDIGPDSELSFAGHGRAWRAADGSFWMLLSANTHDDTGPSDIALATSPDGLTWAIVEPHLFVDGHDPTLLVNADGSVTALWMYLAQTFYTSDSVDGLQWSLPVEVLFYDEEDELLNYSSDTGGDVALLRLGDGSLRLFTNWSDGIRSLVPPQSPIPNIQSPYLLAFHACDTATDDCHDPQNHRVYLAQSDDGADWSLVPGWEPCQGSVPDVIRRGDTLYVYTPNKVRRYRFSTDAWEDPVPVTLTDPEATGGFVDPSPFLDDQGRLVLFYLLGVIGQNPASCAPGETTCVKHFHSAVEVEGSDGTAFVVEPGDRVQVTINMPGSASDPDIFYDGSRYVLYISRGANVQVYTSPTLHGTYALSDSLPDGYLIHGAGIPAGHFDSATARYWTYAHTSEGVIRRAVHASLDVALSEGDFTTVLSGSSIGLGASYRVESPGFAVNTPGPVPDWPVYLPQVARDWSPPTASDLNFVPDPGIRVDYASNVAPSVDPETDIVYLYYWDAANHRNLVATSPDGLSFSPGTPPTEWTHDPRILLMPEPDEHDNPIYRRYLFEPTGEMRSESSSDGIHFTPDPGVRYTAPVEDVEIGVYDHFVDSAGGVVLLYIGDKGGPTASVRRAYSEPSDNGWTFTFDRANVFGDYGLGEGNNYVDPKSIRLPDGRIRVITMQQGTRPPQPGSHKAGALYSFISEDDGQTFTLEPGFRLRAEDFTAFDVWSLNDPWMVRLPDGRYRIYVHGIYDDGSGNIRPAIVSATTSN